MTKLTSIIVTVVCLIGLGGLVYFEYRQKRSTTAPSPTETKTASAPAAPTPTPSLSPAPAPTPVPQSIETKADLVLPIDQFYARITKKTFGLYVTPQNSPVSPEKFTGYHTGVDVEYGDITPDVLVRAIAAGTVQVSKTATGYGGVTAIKHTIDGKQIVAIYGHLRASSMKPVGTSVTAGEQIAVLGTAFSSETSGERRHLHFGLRADDSVSILGYVQKQSELSGWLDPEVFFKEKDI